jgi:hypothetical protein
MNRASFIHASNTAELRQIGIEASASTATQSSNLQGVRAVIFAPQKSGGVK